MRYHLLYRTIIHSIFVILPLVSLVGCNKKEVLYSEKKKLPEKWSKETKNEYQFEIKDTASRYNMLMPITIEGNYPFSNLYLISKFQDPENREIVDTLNYPIAYPDGSPIGNKSGNLYDFFLIYRENFKFRTKGKYRLKITHGMRENPLVGVHEIGLNIEKTKINQNATK